jgi:hypothetical protein
VTALRSALLVPLPQPNPLLWDWAGATGFKSSDLNLFPPGKDFLLPIFQPVVAAGSLLPYQASVKYPGPIGLGNIGVGQNAFYNIVQFVPVRVTQVDKNQALYIQPTSNLNGNSIYLDPTAVFSTSSLAPAGSSTPYIDTLAPPKLTQ